MFTALGKEDCAPVERDVPPWSYKHAARGGANTGVSRVRLLRNGTRETCPSVKQDGALKCGSSEWSVLGYAGDTWPRSSLSQIRRAE